MKVLIFPCNLNIILNYLQIKMKLIYSLYFFDIKFSQSKINSNKFINLFILKII